MTLARPIADALRRGATVVAASPRAARALHLRFAEAQCAAGHTVWPTPSIYDWDSWLRSLWRDHAFSTGDAPVLLTPLQERTLWTRAQRGDAALVISPDLMAALAMDAWSLLSAWKAHSFRQQSWGSNDTQTDAERFRHWATTFEHECTRHGWLSANDLESTLSSLLGNIADLKLPHELLLIGFDRVTPAQRDFLAALESRSITVTDAGSDPQLAQQDAGRSWIVANDRRDEIAACASWVRDLLIENPTAQIAVIVPGIAGARGEIDRIFRRILLPATEDVRHPSSLTPWEFSLGQPLADIPAIRAALLLLRWITEPLQEDEISWLVLSGFVADTVTNHLALARHDARQRRYGLLSPERSLLTWLNTLADLPALRALHLHFGDFLRAVESNKIRSGSRPPSAWTDLAPHLLDRVGWPGPRTADSVQYQALQRWQRLLDEIALLDFDGARYNYADFISLLERQTRETIFSPESHDAPVQIMGPFESSGQQFDAIWFMGTDDAAWPQRGRFHPLLPPALQRQLAMPHAATDDDWNLAHTVTSRLLAAAPRIVFSFAQRDKDAELRPSPLISALFPGDAFPQSTTTFGPAPQPLPTPSLDTIADDSGALPWPHEQNAGGADVLKRQAACPFQAFAAKRLRASPLEDTERGLSPATQGSLLHDVMQRLFSPSTPKSIHSHGDLEAAIAAKALPGILAVHIDAALTARFGSAPLDSWQQACLAAEKRRLLMRIEEWLDIEAERQPFTVEACEKRLPDVHIGDLRLDLRADRIDLLSDGSRLLLDYKTGRISPATWQGERPSDPQLPLYAAYGNVENLSGILFARIRAGETGFEGRVRDARSQLLADQGARTVLVTDPYSDSMRDEWARALENLAEEFLAGEAAVDPRPHACDQCHFQALCRIADLNLAPIGVPGNDDEGPDD
jgi:ATP-dependent helicase/nuclease subunit B